MVMIIYGNKTTKKCAVTTYYNKINKNFINWVHPDNANDIAPNIERISEKDKHPSAKGQQQIAEFIYDRLG
jgi:lysophospholipase L1-like esterase